jgi:hypothetical protein
MQLPAFSQLLNPRHPASDLHEPGDLPGHRQQAFLVGAGREAGGHSGGWRVIGYFGLWLRYMTRQPGRAFDERRIILDRRAELHRALDQLSGNPRRAA